MEGNIGREKHSSLERRYCLLYFLSLPGLLGALLFSLAARPLWRHVVINSEGLSASSEVTPIWDRLRVITQAPFSPHTGSPVLTYATQSREGVYPSWSNSLRAQTDHKNELQARHPSTFGLFMPSDNLPVSRMSGGAIITASSLQIRTQNMCFHLELILGCGELLVARNT